MNHKTSRCLLILGSFLIITGCAQVPMTSEDKDLQAKAFSPPADRASIYIHRHELIGGTQTLRLLVNGLSVGQTAAKSYVLLQVLPGTYIIESHGPENTAQLKITVEAGKNFFVWQESSLGVRHGPRTALHFVDEQTGRAAVLESKRVAVPIPDSRLIPLGAAAAQPNPQEIAASRLRELQKLKNDGLISDDEFQAKRKQLVDQL